MDAKLKNMAEKIKQNLWVGALIEKIKEALENFDANELRNLFDDVTQKNVILEQEFLDKIEDMLDEAEDNPDYQA